MSYFSQVADDKQTNGHDDSDHDERGEMLATEKHWDEKGPDALTEAAKHLQQFKADGTALDTDDWDELDDDEKIPGQIEEALDASLETLAEKELTESEEE